MKGRKPRQKHPCNLITNVLTSEFGNSVYVYQTIGST